MALSTKAMLDMIETELTVERGCTVRHWFTGTAAGARRAVALGCYFSVNAAMLMNERHRALVASLPFERFLTEADGPFVMIADRAVRPIDVVEATTHLAQV